MKVRITQTTPQMTVDEVFTGTTAEDVVRAMQKEVASRVNFALRLMVNALSPLQFAQEVVKRYNDATKKSVPIPRSCQEFIDVGIGEGIVTILEP